MNLRLVLKTYSNLRQLTDDESALLETLRAMNDSERELLMESLGPQKPATRTRKKPAGKKSARASGMAAQLNKQLDGRREPEIGGFADDADMVCDYRYPKDSAVNAGLRCGEGLINGVHDKSMGYAGYHPFQPPASTAESPSTPASSGINGDGAGDVHHAASSGD